MSVSDPLSIAVRRALPRAGWLLALAPLTALANTTSAAPSATIATADAADGSGHPADGDNGQGDNGQKLEEVVVFGRGEQLIGTAEAASEGTVGGADLSVRPMLRVAELLEAVPGLIAAQHSGSGKANQYFLRGFNLDHGTDFTGYIDGMPWNLRSHGHGQGYLDVNGLIPEVVDRIDYRKGPYRADLGDFSLAGASIMTTIDKLNKSFVAAETGQYGWGRLAGGGTMQVGGGDLTVVGQWKTYDGPWQLPENLQHESLWTKYVLPTDLGMLKLSLSGYHATWDPTEQSPQASVGTSVCPTVYCSLDPTAVGETTRWITTAQLLNDQWTASAYAQYYDWHMISDPTYDYQINQFDRRWTVGGRFERSIYESSALQVKAGTELRYDDIGRVGLDHDDAGVFVENVSNNNIKESSIAAYTEATWKATDRLRLTGGLRGDLYNFDVGKNAGAGETTVAGSKSDNQLSPKVGVAYTLTDNVELYANWGQGFHSNDARGVVNKQSAVPGLVKGTGYEGGARFEIGDFKITAAYWWLTTASELIFVGDSNAVEPKAGARRSGYELVAFWKPTDWLGIDAVYTGSNARYKQAQEGEDGLYGYHVEDAVESAGELGVSAVRGKWEASARLRYLGGYALVPSDSQRADAETMVNLRLAYKPGNWTLYGELLNVLNDDGNDIVYYYTTYVPGVSAPGTEEATRLSRAEEPRTLRVGLKYEF
ncbi:MAG: TonB-dependent receptor [Steroidobacteraceae bacterium]